MHKADKSDNIRKILYKNKEIETLIDNKSWGGAAEQLLIRQKKDWPFLNSGYESLIHSQTRDIAFDQFVITLQYNPKRITSTLAKVDDDSIKERDCFLCTFNLPPEQKGILYRGEYLILCNPYPIFPAHFTLPNINHFPQDIASSFEALLKFSKDFSGYYDVFYNGPRSGASAPDHMHFQAGGKMYLPIEKGFDKLKHLFGEVIIKNNSDEILGIDDGIRRFISIRSKNYKLIINVFEELYDILVKLFFDAKEPPLNIISNYNRGKGWHIIIFLRSKHRSSHYFREGKDKILLSPGAVDMGGICILPLQKNFKELNKKTIKEIFNEVGIGKEYFVFVKSSLKERIKNLFQD